MQPIKFTGDRSSPLLKCDTFWCTQFSADFEIFIDSHRADYDFLFSFRIASKFKIWHSSLNFSVWSSVSDLHAPFDCVIERVQSWLKSLIANSIFLLMELSLSAIKFDPMGPVNNILFWGRISKAYVIPLGNKGCIITLMSWTSFESKYSNTKAFLILLSLFYIYLNYHL